MGAGQGLGSMLRCEVVNRENLYRNRSLWMGSHGAFRALVMAVSLQSGICSFVGALLPHSKGGMHVCAQMLQQTFAFASCFSIFFPFVTTTENTACVFPFPQPTEVLDSMKNTSIHCTPQGQGQTDVKKKKRIKIPAALLQCLREAAMPGSLGSECPERWWTEAAWENEVMLWEQKQSSCVGLPGAGTAPAQLWRGGLF